MKQSTCPNCHQTMDFTYLNNLVHIDGTIAYVDDGCACADFALCDNCNDWHHMQDLTEVDDRMLCGECYYLVQPYSDHDVEATEDAWRERRLEI